MNKLDGIPQHIIDKVNKQERERKITFILIAIPWGVIMGLQHYLIGDFIVSMVFVFATIFVLPVLNIFARGDLYR